MLTSETKVNCPLKLVFISQQTLCELREWIVLKEAIFIIQSRTRNKHFLHQIFGFL